MINPHDDLTLGPPTKDELSGGPALTGAQAWAHFTGAFGTSNAVPDSDSVYLGWMTSPLGIGLPQGATGVLAYGYEGPTGPCLPPLSRYQPRFTLPHSVGCGRS